MNYEEALETILIFLERIRKGDLTKEEEYMLRNSMRIFLLKRKGYTDGESFGDVVDGLISDMTIWVMEQKGALVRKEVERVLINKCQKIKDRADRERRKLEVYQLTPLMRLKTSRSPENFFERKQQAQKEIEKANIKAVQDFEAMWAEIQKGAEDEWLFMKRLPLTDPLWNFLGLVGMERFSIFFHDHEGETFKMPTAEKIDRTKQLKQHKQDEAFLEKFVKQVNIWIHQQTSHNVLKK